MRASSGQRIWNGTIVGYSAIQRTVTILSSISTTARILLSSFSGPNIMENSELNNRLLALGTPAVCDANKNLRVMGPAMRPIASGYKFVGVARTVQCHEDFLAVIGTLADSLEGDVLVVDSRNSKRALAGELFSTEAARRGLSALVVDGAVRDTASIEQLGLPVYSRYVTPLAGTTEHPGQTQIPVTCGDVIVNPGDILLGDNDGIVVGSPEEFEALLSTAEAIQQIESRVLGRLNEGHDLVAMLNFEAHYSAIADGKPSKLKFKPD